MRQRDLQVGTATPNAWPVVVERAAALGWKTALTLRLVDPGGPQAGPLLHWEGDAASLQGLDLQRGAQLGVVPRQGWVFGR